MKTGKGQDRAVVEGQFSSQIDIYASDRACARQFPGLDLLERLVRANGEAPRVLELRNTGDCHFVLHKPVL